MAGNPSEIAKNLGLSRTTVMRVLAGKQSEHKISEETAHRILKEAERLKAAPETAAARKSSPRRSLGLVVSDISNPFFGNVAEAVEETAYEAGFATFICTSGENLEREVFHIQNLRDRGVDGLVIAAAGPEYQHLLALREQNFPFVLVDRVFEELECDCVTTDNVRAAMQLCEKLISHGAKRIAFIGGRLATSTGRDRLEGYRAALRRQRIPFDNQLVWCGEYSEECGSSGAARLLQINQPPEAIFCGNNKILTGCLEKLAEAPKVPWAHLPLASFDEGPWTKYLGRPLTYASQPDRRLGQRAAELLVKRITAAGPARMSKPFVRELLEVEHRAFWF